MRFIILLVVILDLLVTVIITNVFWNSEENEILPINEPEDLSYGERIIKGFKYYTFGQKRYTTIPKRGLSRETVGGIFDTYLGKKGLSIIRFDRGHGVSPHINIDPIGRSSYLNPHIPISSTILPGVGFLNTALQYSSSILTPITWLIDGTRIWFSINDDYQNHISGFEDLQKEAENEKYKLMKGKSIEERKQIIEQYEMKLKEIRLAKDYVPCESIKTGFSVLGGWVGGATGAATGSAALTKAGMLVGSVFGPPGTAVGGFLGAVFGAFGAGYYGYMKGEEIGKLAAVKGLETVHDKKYEDEINKRSTIMQNIQYYFDLIF